jgi:hypothetical protein
MTATQPPPRFQAETPGLLANVLVTLAGTPDDVPDMDVRLKALVQLAADSVSGVDYASMTALRDDTYSTVAASSELADAVDEAQYAGHGGPCMQSLDDNTPVTVPDITTTMTWPRFREAAIRMGLNSSVSIPVLVGSGRTIAVLNLYGRDAAAMAPLIVGVWALYDPERPLPSDIEDLPALDEGGKELLTGFAEALTVHSTIQLALGVIMGRAGITIEDAYLNLRLRAVDSGSSLLAEANAIIREDL